MKLHEIAENIGISKEHVGYILNENLDMKIFAQDGCHASSHQINNAVAGKSLNGAWRVVIKKLILCVNLLLWMRLEFTITHQNTKSSQNSKQKQVVQRQRRLLVPSAGKVMASVF